MNHATISHREGFTLIELMLSMAFVSILLIMIAVTVVNVSRTYTRGVTLREVNQVGRSVSEDLQRTFNSSQAFDMTGVNAEYYMVGTNDAGRLCLGRYTYVWNTEIIYASPTPRNIFDDGTKPKFARVVDQNRELCRYGGTGPIMRQQATELITSGDRDLVLHKFTVQQTQGGSASAQGLYYVTFKIGTNDSENLDKTNLVCKPPVTANKLEDYCAINNFELVLRAGNSL